MGEGDLHGANTDLNGKVSKIVTPAKDGQGAVRGYLMKLPIEFHLEDKALKEKKFNRVDEALQSTGDPKGGTSVEADPHKYGDVNISRR